MSIIEKVKQLTQIKESNLQGGGAERIQRQKAKGKLTVRDRINNLVDNGSFVETDAFVESTSVDFEMPEKRAAGDGVVCGYGTINDRPVFIAAQDYTVLYGSMGMVHATKIAKTVDRAVKTGIPMIYLFDSDGARVEEGTDVLFGIGTLLKAQTLASGVIPQIALVSGNCAGAASLSCSLADFVIMTDKISCMYMNGPSVIENATGINPGIDAIGSAEIHSISTGSVHLYYANEQDCFTGIKHLLTFLPDNNRTQPHIIQTDDDASRCTNEIYDIVSDSYDMRDLIKQVCDKGVFLETQPMFGTSIVTGFCSMNGQSVAIVANNPVVNEGRINIYASDKASRFIRFADSFNIPVVTFTHTKGYVADASQEKKGLVRHASKMAYAFSEATVPKINIVTGTSIGGAFVSMNSKAIGADTVYAYPNAVISVMDGTSAASVIYSEQIAKSENPGEFRKQKADEYEKRYCSAYEAAKRGYVDDVIDPAYTRSYINSALQMLVSKREARPDKKHGNMPL